MKKSTFIRSISFCLAGLLAAVGLWVGERHRGEQYRLALQNQYSAALSELDSRMSVIRDTLNKAEYAYSAKKISSYAAELYSGAELAKAAMARLPDGGGQLGSVYKFLSQVGNFALSVSKSVIAGNSVTSEQLDALRSLTRTAKTVSAALEKAHINLDKPDAWGEEISALVADSLEDGALAASLTEMEEDLSDYPTLIYDGPYSDHILQKEPEMLKGKEAVSADDALKAAIKITEDSEVLRHSDEVRGKIDTLVFSGKTATVGITELGGYPIYMRKSRVVSETRLDYTQALAKAKAFMLSNGYNNMLDTYYFTDEGICVINFAYLDGQTLCYTDLIKVGVAMDNGEILLFEASGYITNHTERAFAAPVHTVDEAEKRVSSELKIENRAMVLIPTSGGGEVRCFELLCRAEEGEAILIYINVATLEDEQVFILLESDGGTLVK